MTPALLWKQGIKPELCICMVGPKRPPQAERSKEHPTVVRSSLPNTVEVVWVDSGCTFTAVAQCHGVKSMAVFVLSSQHRVPGSEAAGSLAHLSCLPMLDHNSFVSRDVHFAVASAERVCRETSYPAGGSLEQNQVPHEIDHGSL